MALRLLADTQESYRGCGARNISTECENGGAARRDLNQSWEPGRMRRKKRLRLAGTLRFHFHKLDWKDIDKITQNVTGGHHVEGVAFSFPFVR